MTKDETELLRQARVMRELLRLEGWKEYVKVLDLQIAARERLIAVPLSEMEGGSFEDKALRLELIKGALIGLRLARDTVSMIIDHANEIASRGDRGEDEE